MGRAINTGTSHAQDYNVILFINSSLIKIHSNTTDKKSHFGTESDKIHTKNTQKITHPETKLFTLHLVTRLNQIRNVR